MFRERCMPERKCIRKIMGTILISGGLFISLTKWIFWVFWKLSTGESIELPMDGKGETYVGFGIILLGVTILDPVFTKAKDSLKDLIAKGKDK